MSITLSALRKGAAASLCAGALLLAIAPAHADRAAADACAAALPADGQTIYASVLRQIAPGADMRSIVTDTTKSLAMSGQIDRGNARTNAQAAGQCLQQLRS